MSERHWQDYVRDMLDFCARIAECTAGLSRDEVIGTALIYDATRWNLVVLGEAARNVPAEVRRAHPEIPWNDITGTRDRLLHGYTSIREQIVWDIITRDIPELIPQLHALLEQSTPQDEPHAT